MSVTLWIDTAKDEALELGATFAVYAALAEIARAVGTGWSDEYPNLSGVLTQCELQEDADPAWLIEVGKEAKMVLRDRQAFAEDTVNLLENLATLASGGE